MTAQIIPFPRRADREASGRTNKTDWDAFDRLFDEMFKSNLAWRPATPEWIAHMEAVLAGDE